MKDSEFLKSNKNLQERTSKYLKIMLGNLNYATHCVFSYIGLLRLYMDPEDLCVRT